MMTHPSCCFTVAPAILVCSHFPSLLRRSDIAHVTTKAMFDVRLHNIHDPKLGHQTGDDCEAGLA
jgi:hypothetical protein